MRSGRARLETSRERERSRVIKVEARRLSQGDPRKQGLFSRPHGLTAASTSLPLASPKSHGKLHTVLVPPKRGREPK